MRWWTHSQTHVLEEEDYPHVLQYKEIEVESGAQRKGRLGNSEGNTNWTTLNIVHNNKLVGLPLCVGAISRSWYQIEALVLGYLLM